MVIVILSSVYGNYDVPKVPIKQTVDCRYVLVTDYGIIEDCWLHRDQEGLIPADAYIARHPHVHPRYAAKIPKCRPDLYVDGADIVIWIDGSFEITSPTFVEWCLESSKGWLSQMAHPCRDDIMDEVDASEPMLKYQGLRVREQADHYVAQGFPRSYGLWATGLMVWRRDYGAPNDKLIKFGNSWLAEQHIWTYQDQISEPFVARAHQLRIHTIPGDLWQPQHFKIRNHASEQ